MTKFLLFLLSGLLAFESNAQNTEALIAENATHRKLFLVNEKVKVKFNDYAVTKRIAGRVEAVSTDSFFIRGTKRSTRQKITAIAIKDLKKVKHFYKGGRAFTGMIAMAGVTSGLVMMGDAITNDAIFFPQASIVNAAATIVASLLPYALVTLIEPSYSTKRKYLFRGMKGI